MMELDVFKNHTGAIFSRPRHIWKTDVNEPIREAVRILFQCRVNGPPKKEISKFKVCVKRAWQNVDSFAIF